MSRAEINLTALKHNLNIARGHTQAKLMAVIKANAYGHGMVEVAHALSNADGFAVATIDEAMDLRESGVYQTILVLEGFVRAEELRLVQAYDLHCVIHTESQIKILEKNPDKISKVWFKIDTGMHRLGFDPDEATAMFNRLKNCACIQKPINIMTHLACADDKSSDFTKKQLKLFSQSIKKLKLENETEISIANSAGILAWPDTHAQSQWVRPGIMLYGSSPIMAVNVTDFDLQPVMTLKSEVIALHTFKQGEGIGYGQAYTCESEKTIATIAIGYGDGYPRHAKSGTPVLINGTVCKLVGRVSMDMICVDVSDAQDMTIGDEVTLWGEGLSADRVAEYAGTISYDLFCGVTQRVPFHYNRV